MSLSTLHQIGKNINVIHDCENILTEKHIGILKLHSYPLIFLGNHRNTEFFEIFIIFTTFTHKSLNLLKIYVNLIDS